MLRRILFHSFSLLLSLILISSLAFFSSGKADAANLFEAIFGKQKPNNSVIKKNIQNYNKIQKYNAVPIKPNNPLEALNPESSQKPSQTVKLVKKKKNAKKILVLGDFIARAVSEGLIYHYATDSDYLILKHIEPKSGFFEENGYNWQEHIEEILTNTQPDLVVVALGINDIKYFQDAWHSSPSESLVNLSNQTDLYTHYQTHLKQFLALLKHSRKNWIWLGLPPLPEEQENKIIQRLNIIYEDEAKKYNAHFISSWDSFLDYKGQYIEDITNNDGKSEKLRTKQGDFTKYGQKILASLIADPLELLLLDQKGPAFAPKKSDTAFSPQSIQEVHYIPPSFIYDLDGVNTQLLDKVNKKTTKEDGWNPRISYPKNRADNFLIEK